MRHYLAVFLIAIVFLVPWAVHNFPADVALFGNMIGDAGRELASVVLAHNPVTVQGLLSDYKNADRRDAPKIRILIVPGHEPDYGGAEWGNLKERTMTVELANDLTDLLRKNDRFEVFTTRTDRAWMPEFANYFKSSWDEINAWQKANRAEVAHLQQVGSVTPVNQELKHVVTKNDVGLRLHGINKWANENEMDIVIHIHFNDYPGHGGAPGKYSGFAIYVPERQYYNSTTTKAIADTIFSRLAKYNAVSNLRMEEGGIVEEHDLIAVGSSNSVNAASMLVEYGYIYEPQFADAVRATTMKELAYETYLGVLDFFDPFSAQYMTSTYDTLSLPHTWKDEIDGKNDSVDDVYALQTALMLSGDYPPKGSDLNDCPRSGRFGECTRAALKSFQTKYSIQGETDEVGPKTVSTLNRIYSSTN